MKFKLLQHNSEPKNNLNPLHVFPDTKMNMIFYKGMYAMNKLEMITNMITSGRMSPAHFKYRYQPKIFTYRKYIYELINMIDRIRDNDLMYIRIDARNTIQEYEQVYKEWISTENSKDSFLKGRIINNEE